MRDKKIQWIKQRSLCDVLQLDSVKITQLRRLQSRGKRSAILKIEVYLDKQMFQ